MCRAPELVLTFRQIFLDFQGKVKGHGRIFCHGVVVRFCRDPSVEAEDLPLDGVFYLNAALCFLDVAFRHFDRVTPLAKSVIPTTW